MGANQPTRAGARALTVTAQPRLPEFDGIWPAIARPARRGFALLWVFLASFGFWSCFVLLDGGAIAPGVVSPDGNKKTVQHLEGGIIARLNVREGDIVEANQPLVELESLQARATHDILQQDYRTQLATRIRLETEKAGSASLVFPPELTETGDAEIGRILDDQRHLFTS